MEIPLVPSSMLDLPATGTPTLDFEAVTQRKPAKVTAEPPGAPAAEEPKDFLDLETTRLPGPPAPPVLPASKSPTLELPLKPPKDNPMIFAPTRDLGIRGQGAQKAPADEEPTVQAEIKRLQRADTALQYGWLVFTVLYLLLKAANRKYWPAWPRPTAAGAPHLPRAIPRSGDRDRAADMGWIFVSVLVYAVSCCTG